MTAKLPLSSHTAVDPYEKTGINSTVFTPDVIFSYLKKKKKKQTQKTPFDKPFLKLKFSINVKMLTFSKSLDMQEQMRALTFQLRFKQTEVAKDVSHPVCSTSTRTLFHCRLL